VQILIKQRVPSVRQAKACRRAVKGFTLVEMLIVVAIMAILLALAVPSFNSTVRDNRVLSATNSLAASVAQARSEAVKRGRMVSICPSSGAYTNCVGTNWATGWIIYLENSSVTTGGTPNPDTTDPLLPNGIIAVGSALTNVAVTKTLGNGNSYIRFSPRGLSEETLTLQMKPADSYGNSSVACSPTKANFLEMQVGLVGRTSVTKKPC
jgi:type IV fimbrial biogenesis protein FimT